MYQLCKCSRTHLTREQFQVTWINGHALYTMPNPFYEKKPRGRPRKQSASPTPVVPSLNVTTKTSTGDKHKQFNVPRDNQKTIIYLEGVAPFASSRKAHSPSTFLPQPPKLSKFSPVKSKYEIWHSFKGTFPNNRRLTLPERIKSFHDNGYPVTMQESKSPFDRIPFRPPPGSTNGVTVHRMKNPFANKRAAKLPIDELTRLFYETIDTEPTDPFYCYLTPSSMISQFTPSSSTLSPASTISSPEFVELMEPNFTFKKEAQDSDRKMDNTEEAADVKLNIKQEHDQVDPSVFNTDLPPMTGTSIDEILIMDFNEHEFDQMISDLPDIVSSPLSL